MPKQNDYTLTEEELIQVQKAMKSPNARIARRAQVLHNLHLAYKPSAIAQMQDMSVASVYNHYNRFKSEGIEGLADKPKSGRPAKADETYRQELVQVLETNPEELGLGFSIWTLPRLVVYLQERTGVKLHPDRLGQVLAQMGYVYRRPKKDLAHKQDKKWRAQVQDALDEVKKEPKRVKLGYSIWTKVE